MLARSCELLCFRQTRLRRSDRRRGLGGVWTVGGIADTKTSSERSRTDGPSPSANLRRIGLVHVEKVRHHRFHGRLASTIERHRDHAAKDLQQSAVPVFDDVVIRVKPGVDEVAQTATNLIARVPLCDAETACRILEETVRVGGGRSLSLLVERRPKRDAPDPLVVFVLLPGSRRTEALSSRSFGTSSRAVCLLR